MSGLEGSDHLNEEEYNKAYAEAAAQLDSPSAPEEDDLLKAADELGIDLQAEDTTPDPEPSATYEEKLIIFREVPGFDPRTLVLSYGENSIDLQFCSCPNKYKKRFAAFVADNPEFIGQVRAAALGFKIQGHKVSINDVLDYVKLSDKLQMDPKKFLETNPHDFDFDKIERDYLERKLMMEDAQLFDYFELSPVKCRSNCGYPSDSEPEPEEETTSLAGF